MSADLARDVIPLTRRGFAVFAVDSPETPKCSGIRTDQHDPDTCTQRGKHPCVPFTRAASADAKTVADQFIGTGPRNVGIACGPSGLVILDEDTPGGLAKYAHDHGATIPATFTVTTGKGRHYYFRAPAGVKLGNRSGPLHEYGIDVRAGNGYVVGPGSLHATGALYTIETDMEPAPAPAWLLEALTGSEAGDGGTWERLELPDVIRAPRGKDVPGERDETLFRYAASLRAREVPEGEAVILMRAAWERCEQPPGDEYPLDRALDVLRRAYTTYSAGRSPRYQRIDLPVTTLTASEDGQDDDGAAGDALFDQDVAAEAYRLRVRVAARRAAAAEQAGTLTLPPLRSLSAFLAEPDPPVTYRIDQLWPAGGRVVLSAQHKAGKTTLTGNVLRSLADDRPFLDAYTPTPARRVVLIDNELDENMLRRWLRDQGITNTDTVELIPLRGRVSTFNILDPATRQRWAEHIGPADVLLFDCLRPALDALGLDENRDAGRFLEALDELTTAAGISDTLVIHHMGHHGERSRGDSRILDWPDAVWNLVKDGDDDAAAAFAAPRYLAAYGRDVNVPETQLAFDPLTRHLSVAGGSRRDRKADAALRDVLDALADHPEGLSGRQVEDKLAATEHSREAIRAALRRAITAGEVRTWSGPRRATMHALTEDTHPPSAPVRGSAPPVRQPTESECASAPIEGALTHSHTPDIDPEKSRALNTPNECPDCARPLDQEPLPACGCKDLHEPGVAA